MSARLALMLGAVAMFMAVALGAFGAHALKARLAPDMTAVWQTAVQYHAWHALRIVNVADGTNEILNRTVVQRLLKGDTEL